MNSNGRPTGHRYRLREDPSHHWEIGWDQPQGTSYAQHIQQPPGEPPRNSLEWIGHRFTEIDTVDRLEERMNRALPSEIRRQLVTDQITYPYRGPPELAPALAAIRYPTGDRADRPDRPDQLLMATGYERSGIVAWDPATDVTTLYPQAAWGGDKARAIGAPTRPVRCLRPSHRPGDLPAHTTPRRLSRAGCRPPPRLHRDPQMHRVRGPTTRRTRPQHRARPHLHTVRGRHPRRRRPLAALAPPPPTPGTRRRPTQRRPPLPVPARPDTAPRHAPGSRALDLDHEAGTVDPYDIAPRAEHNLPAPTDPDPFTTDLGTLD